MNMAKTASKNTVQKVDVPKGREWLQWYAKSAPKSIDWYPAVATEVYGDPKAKKFNSLFWGDNKQVLAHLLKEYRGEVDLIYIDPPFDSKADYVKKVKINGAKVEGVKQSIIEEMQYTDVWDKDEYLQFMYERLLIMKELLSDKGSIYLHCDWHRNSHLRLIMDEVFGEDNFLNEVAWYYRRWNIESNQYATNHDTLLWYAKNRGDHIYNQLFIPKSGKSSAQGKAWKSVIDEKGVRRSIQTDEPTKGVPMPDVWHFSEDTLWEVSMINPVADERTDYPTQKPEALLDRVVKASSNEGDLVLDCFVGSGTTSAVAQKLGRRWIACDINKGSIIETTERLRKILDEQKQASLFAKNFKGHDTFKVFTVNHYDVFKNDIEAKRILADVYKVDKLAGSYFDGTLGEDLVKIISPNRVLTKKDIKEVLDGIKKEQSRFTPKATSKGKEAVFSNKVILICSGAELDVRDYERKENKTGVAIEIRDIQADKKELDFREPTEADIQHKIADKKLTVTIADFYSPLLMKRLDLENEKRLSVADRVKVFDYRQAIDHIVIDWNYGEYKEGKEPLFNADAFVHSHKKDAPIETDIVYEYEKKGAYTVAVKIVDVLGEEHFETFEVKI